MRLLAIAASGLALSLVVCSADSPPGVMRMPSLRTSYEGLVQVSSNGLSGVTHYRLTKRGDDPKKSARVEIENKGNVQFSLLSDYRPGPYVLDLLAGDRLVATLFLTIDRQPIEIERVGPREIRDHMEIEGELDVCANNPCMLEFSGPDGSIAREGPWKSTAPDKISASMVWKADPGAYLLRVENDRAISDPIEVYVAKSLPDGGWIGKAASLLCALCPLLLAALVIRKPPFLVDPTTHRFSLSGVQLLVWGAALPWTLFAGWWATGPRTVCWPVVLIAAVVVLTAVASSFLQASRSRPGAAQTSPSVADFFCEYGVFLPERALLTIWTLSAPIALGAVLFAQMGQWTRQQIAIPPVLPGASVVVSCLYLAGKILRPQGPGIRKVKWVDSSPPAMLVEGSALSVQASAAIAGVPCDVELAAPDRECLLPDCATLLRLRPSIPPQAQEGRQLRVVIVNPNGQTAESLLASPPGRQA